MKTRTTITSVPDDVIILEQCEAFKLIMKLYSMKVWSTIKPSDFLNDLFLLENFDEFVRNEMLTNSLPVLITPEAMPRVSNLVGDFKKRYGYIVTSSDKYYVEIRNKLFWEKVSDPKMEDSIKKDMRTFLVAYHLVKKLFEEVNREGIKEWEEKPERYFNHLTGTMNIVLNELPNPNINTVVMAMLHDSIEDIELIDQKVVTSIFWEYLSKWVYSLSKKDLEAYYLSPYEVERLQTMDKEIKKLASEWDDLGNKTENDRRIKELKDMRKIIVEKAKLERQDHYFWHLDELDDNYLTVKFADRIHNLRTLDGMWIESIVKKIKETEKYFLPVAEKRNEVALELMLIEIRKLKKFLAWRTEFLWVKTGSYYETKNWLKAWSFVREAKVTIETDLKWWPRENVWREIDCIFGTAGIKWIKDSYIHGYWDTFTWVCLWRSAMPGEKIEDIGKDLHKFNIKLDLIVE